MVTVFVATQALLSVTFTVYVPIGMLLMVALVVPPGDHE